MGAVLLHCRGVFLGPLAGVMDKMQKWRTQRLPTEPYTEKNIIEHRFGSLNADNQSLNLKEAISEFKQRLRSVLNLNNVKRLSVIYEHCPVLFIAGKQSAWLHRHRNLVEAVKKIHGPNTIVNASIESIEYDNTVSPLIEKPEKVADCLRFFVQGLGIVGFLPQTTATGHTSPKRSILPLPLPVIPDDAVLPPLSADSSAHETPAAHYSPPGTRRRKQVPPPLSRRQMSMADFDRPRGPAALCSFRPTTPPAPVTGDAD